MKKEILPSLLAADFSALKDQIKLTQDAGCKRLHLDVMDGHFVPNITIGPVVIKSIRKATDMYFHTHLMIDNPEKYIDVFQQAGSDAIIIHKEACANFLETIKKIKKLGSHAGVALKPGTPVDTIKDFLAELDMVLIMTVEPGFGGQAFMHDMLEKIKDLKNILDEKGINIPIGVDGGINKDTIKLAANAGASHLIAGNAVFKGDIKHNIDILQKSLLHTP